jgi:pimeloyl-ACP methyl ester carboxylesterase
MTLQPDTRYATNGEVNIAYQVIGEGPIDLLYVPGFISHLDLQWGDPAFTSFFERLASFARVILFDKRGTGLSDPVSGIPTLEERMDDVRAVLDAVGSESTALFGFSEGGLMSSLFAATFPERTKALILFGTYPKGSKEVDAPPWCLGPKQWALLERGLETWGEGNSLEPFAPSLRTGEVERRMYGLFERAAASPRMVRALVDAVYDMDVSDVLPHITVRSLVLHRDAELVPVEAGRFIADSIPDAKYVELEGRDHLPWVADAESVLTEIEDFLTGSRHGPHGERALATVLFTDIVGSTQLASELGDERFTGVLDSHHQIVRRELKRFEGREIDTAGDGFLALFTGPTKAIHCAQEIVQRVQPLGISIRAGVHTGECEMSGDGVHGMAVHVGARVAAQAEAGEVLVSRTVRDLVVGSGIHFDSRGAFQLKGVPDEWELFSAGEASAQATAATEETQRNLSGVDKTMISFVRRAPRLSRTFMKLAQKTGKGGR